MLSEQQNSNHQALKNHMSTIFKITAGAFCWQWISGYFPQQENELLFYVGRCIAAPLADTMATTLYSGLEMRCTTRSQPAVTENFIEQAHETPQRSKKCHFLLLFGVYFLISALWQPIAITGTLLFSVLFGNNLFHKATGGAVAELTINFGLFYYLAKRFDPAAPPAFAAALAEACFYLVGPFALPNSPSGERSLTWATLATCAGGLLGLVLITLYHRYATGCRHAERDGTPEERLALRNTQRRQPTDKQLISFV